MLLLALVALPNAVYASTAQGGGTGNGAAGMDNEGDTSFPQLGPLGRTTELREDDGSLSPALLNALAVASEIDPAAAARLAADIQRKAVVVVVINGDDSMLGVHDWNTIGIEAKWLRNPVAAAVILLHEYDHVENSSRPTNGEGISYDDRIGDNCYGCTHFLLQLSDLARGLSFCGAGEPDPVRCRRAKALVRSLKGIIEGSGAYTSCLSATGSGLCTEYTLGVDIPVTLEETEWSQECGC